MAVRLLSTRARRRCSSQARAGLRADSASECPGSTPSRPSRGCRPPAARAAITVALASAIGLSSGAALAVPAPPITAQEPIATVPLHDPGSADGAALAAAAAALTEPSAEDARAVIDRARTSGALAAAGARLAPLRIDVGAPRAQGSAIGWVGVYYPVFGGGEGVVGQYAVWFDGGSPDVVAEMDLVWRTEGAHLRLVVRDRIVVDGRAPDPGPDGGGFWECFSWCVGASLEHEVYMIFRAVCGAYCAPFYNPVCEACMVLLGAFEAGMVSGCTHACMRSG